MRAAVAPEMPKDVVTLQILLDEYAVEDWMRVEVSMWKKHLDGFVEHASKCWRCGQTRTRWCLMGALYWLQVEGHSHLNRGELDGCPKRRSRG